ncbi:PREDICTED: uncharacterized protein LOC108610111 [Drosophila arizonae]|uniref:Uncharacterized protein LOC108610111 n=1 Tax=Drosophila arizonae TaxID=7263 RepID=A0ABM1NR72_DROAR|nr:PREDICTED: uncharacterized protein LOC108610111 [Drosophila arizonae]
MLNRRKLIREYEQKRLDMLKKLQDEYPLPEAPPDQCRDSFLKKLFAPYDVPLPSLGIPSEGDFFIPKRQHSRLGFGSFPFNAEEKLLSDYHKYARVTAYPIKKSIKPLIEERLSVLDINKLLRLRYGSIAKAIGCFAVLCLLTDVRYRMSVVRDMWRHETNVDRNLRMFSWSIEDYLRRFNRRNENYLDNVELELKGQMDCFKFRVDLKEIIRLVDALYDDFRVKGDICNNSLYLIRDAQVDIMELVTNTRKEEEDRQAQLAEAMQKTPRTADPGGYRHKELNKRINHMDFMVPIEARYRINWAQTTMEQSLMSDELDIKAIEDEVNFYKDRAKEFTYFRELCYLAYDLELSDYKRRISETESAYETSMELVDNEIKVTRNKLSKAVDDLKFYREQIPMFHRKIAEVQEIFAQREEANKPPVVEEPVAPPPKGKGGKKGKK